MTTFWRAATLGAALLATAPVVRVASPGAAGGYVVTWPGQRLNWQSGDAHVWTAVDHGTAGWPGQWRRLDAFAWTAEPAA